MKQYNSNFCIHIGYVKLESLALKVNPHKLSAVVLINILEHRMAVKLPLYIFLFDLNH